MTMRFVLISSFLLMLASAIAYTSSAPAKGLFKANPLLRKVAKNYVKTKVFKGDEAVYRVRKDRNEVEKLILQVMPPTPLYEVSEEAESIVTKFDEKPFIEDHEFSSLVLSNSVWLRAGEIVVKELMYLDSVLHSTMAAPILSEESVEALKNSLLNDNSIVPLLSNEEAIQVCAVALSLTCVEVEALDGLGFAVKDDLIKRGIELCHRLNEEHRDKISEGKSLIHSIIVALSVQHV